MRLIASVVAVGCAMASFGIAGSARASATIDLIWADTGTNEVYLESGATPSELTLQVILTAGPNGSNGAGVSVDYSGLTDQQYVVRFSSTPGGPLPIVLGMTADTGSRIENINSGAIPPSVGTGLAPGQSYQLGTVTFRASGNNWLSGGSEILSDANALTDAVLDGQGRDITATSTFNDAIAWFFHTEPGCDFDIYVKALRGGSPTVSVGKPEAITAKALIHQGTAERGTTIDARLRIDAIDGSEIIDTQVSNGPIRLEVGKGGHGDKLVMNIPQCESGSIDFRAFFSGLDDDGDFCSGERRITKTCK
jgi:hypothetical protein